jgi:glycosyltransferase involved in cell wall biosynthesis
MPKFAFLIPVFNDTKGLRVALQSIRENAPGFEVFVSDNGSCENNKKLIDEYAGSIKVHLNQNTSNLGRTGNWSCLLDIAESHKIEFVKFLFTGEEILPGFQEKIKEILSQNKTVACIVHDYEFNQGNKVSISRSGYNGYMSEKEVAKACLIEGGFLGSIISNIYSVNHSKGIRFDTKFIGKNDFDFELLLGNTSYATRDILTKSNISSRKHFYKTQDYWIVAEHIFNWSYWLEAKKHLLTNKEYILARKNILLTFIAGNASYYSPWEWIIVIKTIINPVLKNSIKYLLKRLFS